MSATAIRPNGKTYTRRAAPTVEAEFDNDQYWGMSTLAVVLRTHDVDEAIALCWAYERWPDGMDTLPAPKLRWVRKRLCMCGGDHAWDLIDDPNRGVPAVEFVRYWR